MEEKTAKKSRLSFRTELVLFGLLLVLIVALPSAIIEIQRPWDELDNLVSKGKIVVSQVKSDFHPYQLKKMNEFALRINASADPELRNYLVWTFNLWFEFCEHETCIMVLTPEYMAKILKDKGMETKNFDFQKLLQAEDFWEKQFATDPGLRIIFKEYKEKLIQVKKSAQAAGFDFNDTYVMTDNGQRLVFLLDGSGWWESSYPGLKYDVQKNDCPYFRDYLKKGPGFYTNPTRYYLKIFPKFDTDQWGSWFSVWLASQDNQGNWNNFALDFDASHVRKLMWTIGSYILTTLLLLTLIIFLVTEKLSQLISKPIHYLMAGAEAVIKANYDHIVPTSGSRDFHSFIQIFNQMLIKLQGLKRLKDALSQTLSPQLAEEIEIHGLPPDGQDLKATIEAGDVAGFTWFTQKLGKLTIRKLLNEYFDIIHAIVVKNNGLNDKMIGDAFLASFGTLRPKETEDAVNAVKTAIEIQLAIRKINEGKKLRGEPFLEWRIGVYSGEDFAGFMGSTIKIDFTTIGETTNLASRLESACEIGHILISAKTYQLVKKYFFEGVDIEPYAKAYTVKGLTNQVAAHNIFVSNLKISKNLQASDPKDFYVYKPIDRKLKRFDSLSPEEQKKFSKVVTITPS